MSTLLILAALLYGINILVGALAQTGRLHLGRTHHFLYLTIFAAAGAATLIDFHPALLLTLGALALLPRARPGGWRHPLLAAVGAGGYLLA